VSGDLTSRIERDDQGLSGRVRGGGNFKPYAS